MPSKYSIKDLERITGIKAHTLRIWEQRYNILYPERTETNIRYYNNSDLKRILNVSLLNNNGYKISHIAKLNDGAIIQEAQKVFNTYSKESDQIENLTFSLIEMDEERFETIINNSVAKFGFENTFEKIVSPFLKNLSNMWLSGIINPAQEHYISNLIRQKLIVGIDNIRHLKGEGKKSFLFFLPDQELHEIGLLYVYYLTKAKGHKCLYLGQSVPIEDLVSVSKLTQPNYLVTIFTSTLPEIKLNDYLKKCSSEMLNIKFLISGRLVFCDNEKVKPPRNVEIFKDFDAFKKLI